MTDSANQNQSTDDQGSGFAKKLDGRRIAVLAGQGVEQVELTDPMRAIRAAGGTPVIVSYSEGSFVAMNNVVSQSVPHLHCHVVPRTKGDGLRGFFWPRTRYDDDADRDAWAARISAVLE